MYLLTIYKIYKITNRFELAYAFIFVTCSYTTKLSLCCSLMYKANVISSTQHVLLIKMRSSCVLMKGQQCWCIFGIICISKSTVMLSSTLSCYTQWHAAARRYHGGCIGVMNMWPPFMTVDFMWRWIRRYPRYVVKGVTSQWLQKTMSYI